ncbi:MAG: hypothetical protein LUG24_07015, partial [Clostridiales bacterium]|nr:hypothetical protein [Clostridiales bacterium]
TFITICAGVCGGMEIMMKKISLAFTAFILIICMLSLTGCSGNNAADDSADETEMSTDNANDENGDEDILDEGYNDADEDENDTEGDGNNENNGADNDYDNNNNDNNDNNGDDGSGNTEDNAGGTVENDATNTETGDDVIDGGTLTNRAGSLFEGGDGIGMRGSENIRGNNLLY